MAFCDLRGYRGWSGGRGVVPRFEDEDHDKSKNNEQKKEYALPLAGVLLVPVEQRKQKEAREDIRL
jgi:hypothetical protein